LATVGGIELRVEGLEGGLVVNEQGQYLLGPADGQRVGQ